MKKLYLKFENIGATVATWHKLLLVLVCSSLLGFASTASAQTPDGETPAVEAVCDKLKADDITRGLYGLCVAFCEAQDFAELATPITEAELLALADNAPSGRILENYNKKRDQANNGIDPTMPCVVVRSGSKCPCWTSDEFSRVDGLTLGQNSDVFGRFLCDTTAAQIVDGNAGGPVTVLQAVYDETVAGEVGSFCTFSDSTQVPHVQRSVTRGLLNEEAKACHSIAHTLCQGLPQL